jgi:hypothetical protein
MPECDRCHKKVKVVRPFPFLFKDMDEKRRPDLGNGYRQYYGCEECVKGEEDFMDRKNAPKASPRRKFTEDISLCPNCHCMTHSVMDSQGKPVYCGKCKKEYPTKVNNYGKAD